MSNVALGYYNAKSFGAAGDGTTDDTAAIQSMFAAMGANSRAGYLPKGDYLISAPVVAPAMTGFHLFGDGPHLSTIRVKDSAFAWSNTNYGALHIPGNTASLTLRDFRIYAGNINRDSQVGAAGANGYAMLHVSCDDGLIQNVEVFGFSASGFSAGSCAGVLLNGASNLTLLRVRAKQCGQQFKFINTNDLITGVGCSTSSDGTFVPNAWSTIYSSSTLSRVRWIGCLFDEATNSAGLPAQHRYFNGSATDIVYEGCTLYTMTGCPTVGLEASGQHVHFRRCRLIPFGGNPNCTGASVASGSSVVLEDCTVTGNGTGKCVTGAGTLYRRGNNTLTGTVDVATNTAQY